jgi:ABC-type Fe2+-enterobactin transport system substrate-binding protein
LVGVAAQRLVQELGQTAGPEEEAAEAVVEPVQRHKEVMAALE